MAQIPLPGLAGCVRCPRLVEYLAGLKPARGRSRDAYHNGPVSGFGDLQARVCLVGLAPGAHGANRTGRPFTGDGAGDFMYPLLHAAGFSNQPNADCDEDGLQLHDLYITNAVKCVPPENKPVASEFNNCRPYMATELAALKNLRVIVALGRGAYDSCLKYFREQGEITRLADYPFAHAAHYRLPSGLWLAACYHTSRYNLQTGRMNSEMFVDFLDLTRRLAQEC
jgi:uracil-DNA glycosylase family 4